MSYFSSISEISEMADTDMDVSNVSNVYNKKEIKKEEIFINLNVISKIEPGDKLLLENETLLNIDTSLFPSLMRWIRGSNRMEILGFINQILEKSFEFHELWTKEEKNQLVFRLTSDLKNALNGLLNLKHTYSTDKLVQSELDVMMENIRTHLYVKKD